MSNQLVEADDMPPVSAIQSLTTDYDSRAMMLAIDVNINIASAIAAPTRASDSRPAA